MHKELLDNSCQDSKSYIHETLCFGEDSCGCCRLRSQSQKKLSASLQTGPRLLFLDDMQQWHRILKSNCLTRM